VKKAAEEAIASLTLARQQGSLDNNALNQFSALHAAMASKMPKLMVTGLDCTQKLLAYRYLGQDGPETQSRVVRVISACSEQEDDNVQLQVVKALLTAVTSGATRETSLLLAVRACYHIHLVSDNVVNRTTAKLTLTQMMDYVFSALELAPEPSLSKPATPTPAHHQPTLEEKIGPIGLGMYPSVQHMLGFDVGADASPLVFHPRPHPLVAPDASAANGDAASLSGAAPLPPVDAGKEDDKDEHKRFNFSSPAHKDAFLLLRTLCKLAMKAMSFEKLTAAGEEAADPIALKSKILSLELILDIIGKAGKRFRESEVILFAIKQYLVPGLMKNCTPPQASQAAEVVRTDPCSPRPRVQPAGGASLHAGVRRDAARVQGAAEARD
jgi:brefeldin A-inhibited guanine nucleotide-exchange protein